MAELVDALACQAGSLLAVRVRLPLSANNLSLSFLIFPVDGVFLPVYSVRTFDRERTIHRTAKEVNSRRGIVRINFLGYILGVKIPSAARRRIKDLPGLS